MTASSPEPAGMIGTAWMNGRIVRPEAATIPIADHGFLYGLGFFETFRSSGGHPHGWSRHGERLLRACATAQIDVPGSFLARDEPRLRSAMRDLLQTHGLPDAVFRYTVTAGEPQPGYARPSELLTLRPLPPPAAAEGIGLRLLQLARDSGEWLPRPKSLNFANALLGGQELQRRAVRPDDEGLFLSREGLVVETVRQSVGWFKGGEFFYPDPALGAVEGTCLRWVREKLAGATPSRVRPGELASADAVLVCNAVRGVTPVRQLWDAADRTVIGEWPSHRDPTVQALRRQWDESLRASFQPA